MLKERLELLQGTLCECFDNGPDLEHRIVVQHLFFDQDGDDIKDFVVTTKYKTLEDYEQWVDRTAPADGVSGVTEPTAELTASAIEDVMEMDEDDSTAGDSSAAAGDSLDSSTTTPPSTSTTSKWGRRLRLFGTSRFYTFSLRIP